MDDEEKGHELNSWPIVIGALVIAGIIIAHLVGH